MLFSLLDYRVHYYRIGTLLSSGAVIVLPIMDNSDDLPAVLLENQITVMDHGSLGSPSPRPLFQYLSPEISAQLLNPRHPQTLATLDGEISSTDALIKSLQALSLFKRQARNSYLPISALPPEILGEIFMAAINDHVRNGITEPLTSSMPMTFGGVCSFWRRVVWGTPLLWTVLYCLISHPTKSQKEAEIVKLWLLRAKGLPLTIRMTFEDETTWVGQNAPHDIINSLCGFSSSWQSVQLVLPQTWYQPLRSISLLPWLEVLSLRPISSMLFNQKMLGGFRHAQKLAFLRYDGMYLNKLDIHWRNITKAFIGGPSLDEVLQFLKICPTITYFHIVNPTESRGIYPTTPIHQLFLEELYIAVGQVEGAQGGGTAIAAHDVIALLTTPVLRKIGMGLPPEDVVNDPLPYVSSLILRSHCPLATVEVFGRDLGDDSVISLLRSSHPILRIVNH